MKLVENLPGHAYELGYQFFEKGDFALVPVCPGNGYYKPMVIEQLLKFVSNNFSKITIFMPDVPAIHTYKGIGYSQIKAEAKARHQGRRLANYCKRSIKNIQETSHKTEFQIIDWYEKISPNQAYKNSVFELNLLYQNNTVFRKEVREETTKVIENQLKEGTHLKDAVDEGIKYVIEELAFLATSHKILQKKQITYIYYTNWPILEDFLEGKYDKKKKSHLGFVRIN